MKEMLKTKRDIARELARKYSTMTHDELDILENVLVQMKFAKGEMILKEGEVCKNIYYIEKGLVRQFYFKKGKDVTEHMAPEGEIIMCMSSILKPNSVLASTISSAFSNVSLVTFTETFPAFSRIGLL